MVEVRELTRKYGEHTAVDNLSFRVESGKIYGFLGPNGAGKTTTMNIITGYIGMTDGSVIINGFDIIKEPRKAKRCIGYLPEQPPLYNDMTPLEYLNFAAELKGLAKDVRGAAVTEVMEKTGLDGMRGRLISNLSKGYRQRVGLAQALLGMPPVLILDEPTSGLDPKQIHEMLSLIRSLAPEHTVLFSSHILSEVQEVCDRILIINGGKLMANGTTGELENMASSRLIDITVKSDEQDRVREMLSAIPGVLCVKCVPRSGGETGVTLEPRGEEDLREKIFNACAENGLPLLMMRPAGASLEAVFLKLTSGTPQDKDSWDAEDCVEEFMYDSDL